MSAERLGSSYISAAASFQSSGNFTVPSSISKIYVSMRGAAGGNHVQGYTGGASTLAGAYVAVAGGASYPIVIGSIGATGQGQQPDYCSAYVFNGRYSVTSCSTYATGAAPTVGGTGGTSTFDSSAVIVYGGTGASISANGSQGSASFNTSLPTLYPAGAVARVNGTTSNTGPTSVSGEAYIFVVPS